MLADENAPRSTRAACWVQPERLLCVIDDEPKVGLATALEDQLTNSVFDEPLFDLECALEDQLEQQLIASPSECDPARPSTTDPPPPPDYPPFTATDNLLLPNTTMSRSMHAD